MTQWTSTADLLPSNGDVLIFLPRTGLMDVANFCGESGYFTCDVYEGLREMRAPEVSHWMVLPSSPSLVNGEAE
jgi:hypothetical protein